MAVILGDFNTKVETEDFLQGKAGKHLLHSETSENSRLLAQLAAEQCLSIESTDFCHNSIYKGT